MAGVAVIFHLVLTCLFVHSDPDIQFDARCTETGSIGEWKMLETKQYVRQREMYVSLLDENCNSNQATSKRKDGSPRSSTSRVQIANGNEITMNIISDYNECNTVITDDVDQINYQNSAILKVTDYLREGNAKRVFYYQYDMTCHVSRFQNISTGNSYLRANFSVVNITETYNKTEEFSFDLSMDFYTDNTFSQPHQAGEITVKTNEMIYVKIKENTANINFKFVVNRCAATTTPTYDVETADVFFDKGCRLDSTFERMGEDNDNDAFSFQIQVFSYIEENSASYFHCQLYICKTDSDASNCQQRCQATNLRQRRGVSGVSKDGGEVMITSKKIVFNKKVTCADILCPLNSYCYPLEPARCLCDDGYVFSRIEKKCTTERHAKVENIHLNYEWNANLTDTKSKDFIELALKYEDLIYKTFIATDATGKIEGVRIIRARQGSIILDTKIIYSPTVTPKVAYEAFVSSITSDVLPGTTARRELKIIDDRKPVLVSQIADEITNVQKITLAIVIVVVLTVIFIGVLVVFKIRKDRHRLAKE